MKDINEIKLTPKQRSFAEHYVDCGNGSEAYRRAYNVKPTISNEVISSKAYELLKNGDISVTIKELRKQQSIGELF